MKRRYAIYLALILLFGNLLNEYGDIFPPGLQKYVPLASACLLGVVSILASNFNPDGTPARRPYLPKSRRKLSIVPRQPNPRR